MFHAALWKLMWLQWRGGCRQFCRNLRTSRGLFYAGFLLLMLGYFVFSTTVEKKFSAVAPPHGLFAEDGLSDLIAFSLCAFTTWTVLFSTGEATVYFTASEPSTPAERTVTERTHHDDRNRSTTALPKTLWPTRICATDRFEN